MLPLARCTGGRPLRGPAASGFRGPWVGPSHRTVAPEGHLAWFLRRARRPRGWRDLRDVVVAGQPQRHGGPGDQASIADIAVAFDARGCPRSGAPQAFLGQTPPLPRPTPRGPTDGSGARKMGAPAWSSLGRSRRDVRLQCRGSGSALRRGSRQHAGSHRSSGARRPQAGRSQPRARSTAASHRWWRRSASSAAASGSQRRSSCHSAASSSVDDHTPSVSPAT